MKLSIVRRSLTYKLLRVLHDLRGKFFSRLFVLFVAVRCSSCDQADKGHYKQMATAKPS